MAPKRVNKFKEYKRKEGEALAGTYLMDDYVRRYITPPGIYNSEKYDRMVRIGDFRRSIFKLNFLKDGWTYEDSIEEVKRIREEFEDSITKKQFKEYMSKKETGWSYEDDWCYHSFVERPSLGGSFCVFCAIIREDLLTKPGLSISSHYSFTYLDK